jgi:hypothetical protein
VCLVTDATKALTMDSLRSHASRDETETI